MVRITIAAASAAILLGIGLASAQAQPAAAPQCASPVRQYIVYFPAGKSDLTTDGESVVKQAVAFGGAGAAFSVNGHTDGVEPAILSLERTTAISQSLTKAGVPNNKIDIAAAGNSQLAVPTTNAEPLNRRGTITVCKA